MHVHTLNEKQLVGVDHITTVSPSAIIEKESQSRDVTATSYTSFIGVMNYCTNPEDVDLIR